jgi:hypothetical protein
MSGQIHTPADLPLGRELPSTYWIEVWMEPRTGLEDVEKRKFFILPGLELRPHSRPARRQSLLFFFIWFVRLLALRPLLAYCASLR